MTKAIADHERSCIKNPERDCWACKEFVLEQLPMTDLRKAFQEGGIHGVSKITDCPACKLAAILQEKEFNPDGFDGDEGFFDYKGEMAQMWKDKHRSDYENIAF
jgi:hypothetical protein